MMCPLQSKENTEILLGYCSRSLPADTLARWDAHVEMCASCQQELGAQQALWSALDEFDATALEIEMQVSPDFDRRLYARIEAEHRDPVWVRAWRSIFASGQPGAWRPAFSMMAVAGVAVLALLLVRMPDVVSPVGEKPVAAVAVTGTEASAGGPTFKTSAIKTVTLDKEVERLDTALEDLEMLHLLGSSSGAAKPSSI